MIDQPALPLRRRRQQHLLDNLWQRSGFGLDCAGQRIAAEGPESNHLHFRHFIGFQGKSVIIDQYLDAISIDDWAFGGKIEWHNGNLFKVNVLPDVQFSPIGQGEYPDLLSHVVFRVVDIPQFGPLVLWVPAVIAVPEGVDALFGPGLFLVSPGAAKDRVELVLVQSLFECLCLHDVGVFLAAMGKGTDTCINPLLIDVDDKIQAELLDEGIAESDHLLEFPGGVDVHQWEGRLTWSECFEGQVQHDRGVFAYGIEHDRVVEFGGYFTDDVNAFRFQFFQVGKAVFGHGCREGSLRRSANIAHRPISLNGEWVFS